MKKETMFGMSSKGFVSGLIAVCFVIIFGIGGLAVANQGSLEDKIANVAGTIIGNDFLKQLAGDLTFGYVGDTPTYLTDKRPGELVTYKNIYTPGDLEVTGNSYFTGSMTTYSTTTLPLNTVLGINVALTQVATTSYASTSPIAAIRNNGIDKLCKQPSVYVRSGNGRWSSNISVGTTTCSTSGSTCGTATASYAATSTATLIAETALSSAASKVVYSPALNAQAGTWYANMASASNTVPWLWRNDEWLLVYDDQDSATSSASYTSTGGFTQLVGALTTFCWNAY